MMHSNTGTLGEIVGRTCTHRAFHEKERNLGGGEGVEENSHKIISYVYRHFDSVFKVCICWAVYVANIKMFGPKLVEL